MTPRRSPPPAGAAIGAARRAALPRLDTGRLVLRAPDRAGLPAWTRLSAGRCVARHGRIA